MKIKNRDDLICSGDGESRRIVLDVLDSVLERLDTYKLVQRAVAFNGKVLKIGDCSWDISRKKRVVVIGAGKACNAMVKALDEIMGPAISNGFGIVKHLEPEDKPKHIELVKGGHPLPNPSGLEATRRILNLVSQSTPDDLFITAISGGSSALMCCPVEGISLDDEIEITRQLLSSGARILEINAVRRHISAVNGGRLAQAIDASGAEMINLIISDSVGAPPTSDDLSPCSFFGTPVAPDTTTLSDARNVLNKYGLVSCAPRSITKWLDHPDKEKETPKALSSRVRHFVLQRPADACQVALRLTQEMGLSGLVLTTLLQGESREAGTFLGCIAREAAQNGRPLSPPGLMIAGGETTTKIMEQGGLGGPSQELALAFALEVSDRKGLCLAAVDTDGSDGITTNAGGLTDGTTIARAKNLGLDVYGRLIAHDSASLLNAVGDAIVTGNTGTNVCDLNLIYIG